MSNQQSIKKYTVCVGIDTNKGDTILSPAFTTTPASKKRIRTLSSPELQQQDTKTSKMTEEVSLKVIYDEIVALRKETKEYSRTVEFLSAKYDEVIKLFEKLQEENKETKKELRDEKQKCIENERRIDDLEAKIDNLEVSADNQEHYTRRLNLLFDIPENTKDITQAVIEWCGKLEVDLDEDQIDIAHKLGKAEFGKQRTVIVRFTTMKKRNEIINKMRSVLREKRRKKESLQDIPRIREHLTQWRANLFTAARQVQRDKKFCSSFVRNGIVFIQKEVGSKPIIVTGHNMLQSL